MGLFSFIQKEILINRLVRNYKEAYHCDDMSAIMNLRSNYSKDELKEIINEFKNDPNIRGFNLKLYFKDHNSMI